MTDHGEQLACAGRGSLEQAVLLNEEIKQVIGYAAQVNMTALNANLMARRAGDGSRGFRVVAAELRGFSDRLERHMLALGRLIFRQVGGIAHMRKVQRFKNLFGQAGRLSKSGYLDASLVILDHQTHAACQGVAEGWRHLTKTVVHATRLCRAGESLVWSARMEAARGGDMEPMLRQVAENIARVMADIGGSLQRQRALLIGLLP